jgi:CDP-diglyceride synthetase
MQKIDWQSNGAKRVITSVCIIAGVALAFCLRLLTVWVFDAFVLAFCFTAVWEVMRAKRTADAKGVYLYYQKRPNKVIGGNQLPYMFAYMFVAYVMMLTGLITKFSLWLHIVMQIVAIILFSVYVLAMNYMDKEFIKEAELKHVGVGRAAAASVLDFWANVLYPFLLLFTLIPLNHLGQWSTYSAVAGADPVAVPMVATLGLVLVIMISCFTDTCAYLTGLTLKGKKLCPKVSPKKTISGAIGGLFGGIIGALLTVLFLTLNLPLQLYLTARIGGTWEVQLVFIGIGLVGSIMTQAGDLWASWIKRRAGIKDYGKFLPGHGGAMDRLDGICFNSAFIFLVFMFLALI